MRTEIPLASKLHGPTLLLETWKYEPRGWRTEPPHAFTSFTFLPEEERSLLALGMGLEGNAQSKEHSKKLLHINVES